MNAGVEFKELAISETAAVDALTFQQHCHYNEVVNPLEFLLEWDNILGHRTRQ